MSETREIEDVDRLYHRFSTAPPAGRWQARGIVNTLGQRLAAQTAAQLPSSERVLCAVILRGGALLYPPFASRLPTADFVMLGLQRHPDGVRCNYLSAVPQAHYDRLVYLDCVCASGSTVLAARATLAEHCLFDRELAAVICSSAPGSLALGAHDIDLIGFSLHEQVDCGIVSPDLGELDAGDLFSSALAQHAGAAADPS